VLNPWELEADHIDIMTNSKSVDLDDWNLGALGCLEPGNLEIGDLDRGNPEECRIRAFFAQDRFGYHPCCRSAHEPVTVLVMMRLRHRSNGRETLQMILPSLCRPRFHACANFDTASLVSWTAGVLHSRRHIERTHSVTAEHHALQPG
jgi:hypothetical protein